MGFSQTSSYPLDESRTLRGSLIWAIAFLRAQGLPDPRLSAELLLASLLNLDRLGVFLAFDEVLPKNKWQAFEEKIRRRANHEPIAYLTGQKEFWSLDFEVGPSVLIPRPETEILVEESLKILNRPGRVKTVVELGTGSGAVAIALAASMNQQKPGLILASDIDGPALGMAQKNAVRHGVESLISFIQGDWLEPFSERRRWIDLLVSNPPYISPTELPGLPATVLSYEPRKALDGGRDGLEAIRTIIRQAGKHLRNGGTLVLEMGENQAAQVVKTALENNFNPALIRQDYAGKNRVLVACYHG
jgi:release factor glutamine methyltransferase